MMLFIPIQTNQQAFWDAVDAFFDKDSEGYTQLVIDIGKNRQADYLFGLSMSHDDEVAEWRLLSEKNLATELMALSNWYNSAEYAEQIKKDLADADH